MAIRLIVLPALLVVAALGSACDVRVGENGVSLDVAGGKATDEWTRISTIAPGGTVEVVNLNGPIVVEAASGPQVEIRATRVAKAKSDADARELLRTVEIQETVAADRVAVQTVRGRGNVSRSVHVEYRVRVPPGIRVSVKTDGGGIGLYDVNATVAATITNGGVRGTNVSGAVSARIVNGGILLDMAHVAGPVDLQTVNGSIRLDIPPDVNAAVDAHAVNGNVAMGDGLKVETSSRSRTRIAGTVNGGGPLISVSAVNGGIRLRVRDGSVSRDAEGGDEAGEIVLEQGR